MRDWGSRGGGSRSGREGLRGRVAHRWRGEWMVMAFPVVGVGVAWTVMLIMMVMVFRVAAGELAVKVWVSQLQDNWGW